jgi:tetratricopeptide (TPR) repeat protein
VRTPSVFVAQFVDGEASPVLAAMIAFLHAVGAIVRELDGNERGEHLTEATRREMGMCPITVIYFAGGLPQSQTPKAMRIVHTWTGLNPTRTVLALVDRPLPSGGLRERMLRHRALDETDEEAVAVGQHLARLIHPPAYDPSDPPLDLHEWLAHGTARNLWGQPQAALSAFRQAEQLQPNEHSVQTNLAYTHMRLGQWEEGIRLGEARKALMGLWCAGQCHVALRQYEQARAAYRRALTVWPTYSAALLGLGEVYWHLGQMEQARDCLLRATEYHNFDDAWGCDHLTVARRAWEHLSAIYEAEGEHGQAAEAAARAAELTE